jgi:hypothetical protein
LTILSALIHIYHHANPLPDRLAIFTDNGNTVSMFNSLHALPPYNPILISAVDILRTSSMQLRVFFIPGQNNIVADALSRFNDTTALQHVPALSISSFIPPRLSLVDALL